MTSKAKTVEVWMPFLVDKYLGDTTHLSTEQHGAYMLLLLTMWKRDGVLPADDRQLASISKLSLAKWRSYRPVLIDFFSVDGGTLRQKRLAAELVRAKANLAQRVSAGIASAEARKGAHAKSPDGRDDGGDGTETATAAATAVPTSVPTGTPTNTPTEAQREGQRNVRPIPIPIPSSLRSEKDAAPDGAAGAQPAAGDPEPADAKPDPKPRSAELTECPHAEIIDAFHAALPMARHVRDWTPTRQARLRTRWREDPRRQNVEWWSRFFAYCATSPFLTGRRQQPGRRPFELSLDWLVTSENFVKVREGAFHDAEQEVTT